MLFLQETNTVWTGLDLYTLMRSDQPKKNIQLKWHEAKGWGMHCCQTIKPNVCHPLYLIYLITG